MRTTLDKADGTEDFEAAIAGSGRPWWSLPSNKTPEARSNPASQGIITSSAATKSKVLYPHVWAESLKLHGKPELNSPLAG
jgi:hypothetical protein